MKRPFRLSNLVATGTNPRGVVAIGTNAVGVIAIGVNAVGVVAIGVNAVGSVFATGLFATAPLTDGFLYAFGATNYSNWDGEDLWPVWPRYQPERFAGERLLVSTAIFVAAIVWRRIARSAATATSTSPSALEAKRVRRFDALAAATTPTTLLVDGASVVAAQVALTRDGERVLADADSSVRRFLRDVASEGPFLVRMQKEEVPADASVGFRDSAQPQAHYLVLELREPEATERGVEPPVPYAAFAESAGLALAATVAATIGYALMGTR